VRCGRWVRCKEIVSTPADLRSKMEMITSLKEALNGRMMCEMRKMDNIVSTPAGLRSKLKMITSLKEALNG